MSKQDGVESKAKMDTALLRSDLHGDGQRRRRAAATERAVARVTPAVRAAGLRARARKADARHQLHPRIVVERDVDFARRRDRDARDRTGTYGTESMIAPTIDVAGAQRARVQITRRHLRAAAEAI